MSRSFDGVADMALRVGSAPLTAPPFTIAAWFYKTVLNTAGAICVLWLGGDDHSDLRVASNNRVNARIEAGGVGFSADTSEIITVNTWHHGCGVYKATDDRTSYLDGTDPGTSTDTSVPATPDEFEIGIRGTAVNWEGWIGEVGLWNVALIATEVASLASGYSPLFIRPWALVGYWPLVRDEDQDLVGGFNLTATNGPGIAEHPPVIYPAPPSFISIPAIIATRRVFITHT